MEKHSQPHGIRSHGFFPFNSDSGSASDRAHEFEIRFRDQKGTYKLRFDLSEARVRQGGGRKIP